MFVCKLNLRGKDRRPILAGDPFNKVDLVEATFESLLATGEIEAYNSEEPLKVIAKPIGSNKTPAIKSQTPAAAINPVKKDRVDTYANVLKQEKAKTAKKTKKKTQKKAKAEKPVEKVKREGPDGIWVGDPELLKDIPFEQLMAAYKETCAKYALDVEPFDTKELLIEKMCSASGK